MTEININTIDEAEIFYRNMIGLKIPTKTKKNKGEFGQLVESAIGHAPSSAHLDLDDGEIKTVCLKPNNQVKEDLKIAKVWDKDYLEKKMKNLLVIVRDTENTIIDVKRCSPLNNPTFLKYFNSEFEQIMKIGLDKVSQSDTIVWVAKTNDSGKKQKNARAFYLARAFVSALLDYEFNSRKLGAKEIYKEYKSNV
mgnify:FL=1|tara:strand:+ start:369 stop:953 length:585 start_codon:yes stop_codon:yes gene_type:complete